MKVKYKNLILMLFLCNFSIAEDDIGSSLLSSDKDLSMYSESILIGAIDNVRKKKIDKALEQLNKLIKINPDFKAAQLIYADLMLSRSQKITDFGNIQNASFDHINSLLSEVKARWDFHKITIEKDKIPSSLIKLANSQSHVIIVDALTSRLFLFENENGTPRMKGDFYVTIGKNGTGKYTEGDQKTPTGVYFVTGLFHQRIYQIFTAMAHFLLIIQTTGINGMAEQVMAYGCMAPQAQSIVEHLRIVMAASLLVIMI